MKKSIKTRYEIEKTTCTYPFWRIYKNGQVVERFEEDNNASSTLLLSRYIDDNKNSSFSVCVAPCTSIEELKKNVVWANAHEYQHQPQPTTTPPPINQNIGGFSPKFSEIMGMITAIQGQSTSQNTQQQQMLKDGYQLQISMLEKHHKSEIENKNRTIEGLEKELDTCLSELEKVRENESTFNTKELLNMFINKGGDTQPVEGYNLDEDTESKLMYLIDEDSNFPMVIQKLYAMFTEQNELYSKMYE